MFTTIIVQPIFNLLVLIYALIPGHNFGVAIIIFTIIVRILMWPLVKKQLHQARAMRELAPEIKKIKAATKGDRQRESQLTMELYREREINPFASLGVAIIQIPILIGLYSGLRKIIDDPNQIITFSYSFLHHLPWMETLSSDIHKFDDSLFGVVNLTRTAIETGGIYWSAMFIVVASAIAQYFQTKQLMPQDPEARSLRKILSEAGSGKQTDQSEVNAAVSRSTQYLVPVMVFLIALRLAVALPLYWLTSSVVAYIQQSRALKKDADIADATLATDDKPIKIESKVSPRKNKKSSKKSSNKRRKK
ncbi:MAG TPA: YidC/Oxa1 family membrane protein insertase [Candidatus Saccharimonadales bacterium]|nr:YidC/Oxa1 family membrane protein insertase [Candidatus Saccharimonadales bacterium]